jgi:hypothetical protein
LDISCLGTASKHVIEGKIKGMINWRKEEEEDVSRYWMTLRK